MRVAVGAFHRRLWIQSAMAIDMQKGGAVAKRSIYFTLLLFSPYFPLPLILSAFFRDFSQKYNNTQQPFLVVLF
jgi:hypothetical protein